MLLKWVLLVLSALSAKTAPSPKAKAQSFSPYGNAKTSASAAPATETLTLANQNAALKSDNQVQSFGASSNQGPSIVIQPEFEQVISNSASQTAALTAEFANEMSSGQMNIADSLIDQSSPIIITPRIFMGSRSANLISQPFTLHVLGNNQQSELSSSLVEAELTGHPESSAITLDSPGNQASFVVASQPKVANTIVGSEVEGLIENLKTTDSGHEQQTMSGRLVDEATSSVVTNSEAQAIFKSAGALVGTQALENQGAAHISGNKVQSFGSSSNQGAAIVIQPEIVNLNSDGTSPTAALNTEFANGVSSGSHLNMATTISGRETANVITSPLSLANRNANFISQPFTLQILSNSPGIQGTGLSSRLVQADSTGVQRSFSVAGQQNFEDAITIPFSRIALAAGPVLASVPASNQDKMAQLTPNIAQIREAKGRASASSITLDKLSATTNGSDIQAVAHSPESERNILTQGSSGKLTALKTAQEASENLKTTYSRPQQQSSSGSTSGRLINRVNIASVDTNSDAEIISTSAGSTASTITLEKQGAALMAESPIQSFGSSADQGVVIDMQPEIAKTTSGATPQKAAFTAEFANGVSSGQLNTDATFSGQATTSNISPLVTLGNMNANLVSQPFTLQILSSNQGSEGSGLSSRLVKADSLGVEGSSGLNIDSVVIQEASAVSGPQNIVHAVSIPFSRITLADGTVINRLENNISLDIRQI